MIRRLKRRITYLSIATLIVGGWYTGRALPSEPAPTSTTTTEYSGPLVVSKVVDGDTVKLTSGVTMRLIGVDTPETVHPTKPVQCYGPEASSFTKSLLPEGTEVKVRYDKESNDRYGRELVYLYRSSDGLFVNRELIAGGYAKPLAIKPNVQYQDEFSEIASQAKEKQVGLWGKCQ